MEVEIKVEDGLTIYPTSTTRNGKIRQLCVYGEDGRVMGEITKQWNGDGDILNNYHDGDWEFVMRGDKYFIRFYRKGE